jgi:hypothetical protein
MAAVPIPPPSSSTDFPARSMPASTPHSTRPYRPQTNGKIERFHQTMGTEWAYGMTYASARARARALPYWMSHYNERRPHSALAGKAPIGRVRSEPL